MKRMIITAVRSAATLALACSTALAFAVATVQARPTHTARSQATVTPSTCKIVVTGTPWRIRAAGGTLAGNTYTIAGKGISCSAARTWVSKFTHQPDTGQIKGPAGFNCRSFSTAVSGDKLLYSGVCLHSPQNVPFFEWAPKMPRS